ncbi:MAG: hypothetical protein ACFFDT_02705 [Candidatus Hodarchaeota archaeon]
MNSEETYNDEESICGIVSVIFSADLGPDLGTNDSDLTLESAIFLSLRGFTALMAGVDYDKHGPGKIRGIIEIPKSPYYAVGFDVVLKKREIEEDHRLFENSPALLFVTVKNEHMGLVRRLWDNLETHLTNLTKKFVSIDDLTEENVRDIRKSVNRFLDKEKLKTPKVEAKKLTLFDLSTLLSFDPFMSHVAQALMDIQVSGTKKNITTHDVAKKIEECYSETDKALKKLVQMGYVSMTIVDDPDEEPSFRAI